MRKTVKRLICLCLAIGMMFSVVGLPASAYSTWAGHHIGSGKTLSFVPDSTFTALSIQHMKESMKKWETPVNRALMTMSTTTHSSSNNYQKRDGKNSICKENVGSATYVAQTWATDYDWWTGEWKEVDINFNTHYTFANSGQKGKYDTYSIFLHEAGHVCGLDHALLSSAVMYPDSDTGVEKRSLTSDDINGVRAVYNQLS